jgi:two-component system, chemotaxis family, chemotaxis protein CheY
VNGSVRAREIRSHTLTFWRHFFAAQFGEIFGNWCFLTIRFLGLASQLLSVKAARFRLIDSVSYKQRTFVMNIPNRECLDVLVVDQDRSQFQLLADAIGEAGYLFHHAIDGYGALQLTSARPSRLWLANMQLSDTPGVELLKIIKAKRPNVPFYLLSDDYSVADELAARAAGATGYLNKPVDESWIELCLATLSRRTVRAGPRPHILKSSSPQHIIQPPTRPLSP